MIISHLPDVNPDLYYYESKLSITSCEAFMYDLLTRINTDGPDFLVQKKKYVSAAEIRELVFEKATPEERRILLSRFLQSKRDFPDQTPIEFRQYSLPPDLNSAFVEIIPQWIKDLGEFTIGVQISREGVLNPIHKGHKRITSLFFLLQSDGEETRWYRETKPFPVVDYFRVPDYNKIEQAVCVNIATNKWTLFNHKEWHSVHKHEQKHMDRININIDFEDVTMEQLLKKVKEQELK